MLCCAALVLVIGVVREVWFRLPGTTRPAEVGFAPVAVRPAPGSVEVVPIVCTPAKLTPPLPVRGHFATALLMLALGTLVYGLSIYALVAVGAAAPAAGTLGDWLQRDVILGVLIAGMALAAARLPRPVRPLPPNHGRGLVLLGLGAAWWFLGILDMHAFGLFQIAGGSLFWDVAFHGAGGALILIGAALYAGKAGETAVRLPMIEMSERGF